MQDILNRKDKPAEKSKLPLPPTMPPIMPALPPSSANPHPSVPVVSLQPSQAHIIPIKEIPQYQMPNQLGDLPVPPKPVMQPFGMGLQYPMPSDRSYIPPQHQLYQGQMMAPHGSFLPFVQHGMMQGGLMPLPHIPFIQMTQQPQQMVPLQKPHPVQPENQPQLSKAEQLKLLIKSKVKREEGLKHE
jgi:hypothetical protein